jgi:polysaccharide deacetylase 2 family uncharacterized protein YibQ
VETNPIRQFDGGMTKRRHISDPSGEPPKPKGPGAPWLAVAILLAGAVGVGFALGGERGKASLTPLSLRLPEGLAQSATGAPEVLPSLRLGGWPDWLNGQPEGTKRKSEAAPEAVPMLPAIAIVIDDCGVDEARTRIAMALPAAMTLAFLPYGGASSSLSHQAHMGGHEIIVHLPMEPKGAENPGPMPLTDGLSAAEITQRLDWALSRVSDYDGANNHMGSRFTTSREALLPVMRELSVRKLFFLDSRTTADSQAEKLARETGMLTGARDIFLDNDETAPAVERALASLENQARSHGSAIAIGHPHAETLAALKIWSNDVEARGFRLVPLRAVLELRAGEQKPATVSKLAHSP